MKKKISNWSNHNCNDKIYHYREDDESNEMMSHYGANPKYDSSEFFLRPNTIKNYASKRTGFKYSIGNRVLQIRRGGKVEVFWGHNFTIDERSNRINSIHNYS